MLVDMIAHWRRRPVLAAAVVCPTNWAPRKRVFLGAALATLLLVAAPATTSADQAVVGVGDMRELAPGEVIVKAEPLRISHFGTPNVAYEDASFVPGETVSATITGVVVRGRFAREPLLDHPGHAELLSSATLSATVPLTWRTDLSTELVFDPPVAIWYQAPTTAALGCARHQGEGTSLRVGITADFAGSSGTEAWIDETSAIPFAEIIGPEIGCPVRSDFDGDGDADLAIGAPGDRGGIGERRRRSERPQRLEPRPLGRRRSAVDAGPSRGSGREPGQSAVRSCARAPVTSTATARRTSQSGRRSIASAGCVQAA